MSRKTNESPSSRKRPRQPASQPVSGWRAWPWRRWLLSAGLLGFGLAAGFLTPYLWLIDRQVSEEFGRWQWQEPTRVYARPLTLSSGLPMNADALLIELQAARYRDDGEGRRPGRYARDGDSFTISRRAFRDLGAALGEARFTVTLSGGRVRSIVDAASGKPLPQATLDPERIATLYGKQNEERRLVQLEDVPPLLITALQAVEDRDFKHHRGVDPLAILRALWVNLRSGEIEQGGSTLTQQLVRNLFLDRGQRWSRKFNEALYALVIEARFDKRRILEAYLNQVYLGQDGGQAIHGVAAAAEFWFGHDVSRLSPGEIALLVGMIRGPSYYDPRRYPERASERRNRVLAQMRDTGLIDAATAKSAQAAGLGVLARPGSPRNRYPAFLDFVRRQLAAQYPEDALRGAGLSVMTTLAPSTQRLAEQSVDDALDALQEDRPPLQASVLVTDARSATIAAMVGDRHSGAHGFNRALDARRPIGSLMKPFVYLLALAQPSRWTLATPLYDEPIEVPLRRGESWSPENYDHQSHGQLPLIDALANSYNQATVRLGMDVGVERLSRLIEALAGFAPPAHPSLLLGAADLSPLQTTQLYQFLVSGGRLEHLRAVRGVLDGNGIALARFEHEPPAAQRGDELATRLLTLALQQVVESGTGRRLLADGLGWLHLAGKTGTSNDSRDSWFAGYSGSHLAVVWVGNDDNLETGLTGSSGALPVFSRLFRQLPTEPLKVSDDGLQWLEVDPDKYALTDPDCPRARRFAFVVGSAPRGVEHCTWSQIRGWFGDDDGSAEDDWRRSDEAERARIEAERQWRHSRQDARREQRDRRRLLPNERRAREELKGDR